MRRIAEKVFYALGFWDNPPDSLRRHLYEWSFPLARWATINKARAERHRATIKAAESFGQVVYKPTRRYPEDF